MPDTMPRKFQICVFVLILFLFFHRDNSCCDTEVNTYGADRD